jgi:signal transduction histidine kinase
LNVHDLNLVVRADEKCFRQVLAGLIQNAIKFTKPGGNVHVKI